MNVEKAKNVVIIILILLNAIIFYLIREKENVYVISESQENAIIKVLGNNGISLAVPLLKDYPPMKELLMEAFDYSNLESLLFEGAKTEEIIESYEHNNRIKRYYSNSTISIEGNRFTFSNPVGLIPGRLGTNENFPVFSGITLEQALAICNIVINVFQTDGLSFIQNHFYNINNNYVIEYIGVYNGMVIASNIIYFTVGDNGITYINCSVMTPYGYGSSPREIYSSDEALFALINRVKSDFGESDRIVVTDMKIGYYNNEKAGSSTATVAPHYLFLVKNDPDAESGILYRYLVNAYTCQIAN